MPYRLYLGNYVTKGGPVTPTVEQVSSIGVLPEVQRAARQSQCSLSLVYAPPVISGYLTSPPLVQVHLGLSFSLSPELIAHLSAALSWPLSYRTDLWMRRRLIKYMKASQLKKRRESDMRDDEEEFGEQA